MQVNWILREFFEWYFDNYCSEFKVNTSMTGSIIELVYFMNIFAHCRQAFRSDSILLRHVTSVKYFTLEFILSYVLMLYVMLLSSVLRKFLVEGLILLHWVVLLKTATFVKQNELNLQCILYHCILCLLHKLYAVLQNTVNSQFNGLIVGKRP